MLVAGGSSGRRAAQGNALGLTAKMACFLFPVSGFLSGPETGNRKQRQTVGFSDSLRSEVPIPTWNSGIGRWEGTGVYLSLGRDTSKPSRLTEAETAARERLRGWFLDWTPPTEPFNLAPHRRVSDPARWHAYYAALIRESSAGTMRQEAYVHLLAFAQTFGGPT